MSDFEAMKASLEEVCGIVNGYIEKCPYFYDHTLKEITTGTLAYLTRPGKKARPAVLIWSYLACGGDPEALEGVLPIACGLEATHTWTLIHDDIIDCDEKRRGGDSMHVIGRKLAGSLFGVDEPAAAEKYGETYSILIGDTLHAISVAMMLDSVRAGVPAEIACEIVRLLQGETMRYLIEGELLDVNFEYMQPGEVDCETILRMIRGKTSSLLSYSALFGAMLGVGTADKNHPTVRNVGDYANACGTAFQLKDDILGLTGDEKALGKPVGSDLREGKKTYPIYLAIERMSESEKARFFGIYGNPGASGEELAEAAELIRRTGAIAETEALAVSLVDKAKPLIGGLPDTLYKRHLLGWGDYMVRRSH